MTLPTVSLPTTAIAVVAHGADDIRVEDVAVAAAAENEALVSIAYGGICDSDLHY